MNATKRNDDETAGDSGAVDQEAFEQAIRDNLSPEGVAAVISYLRVAEFDVPKNEAARAAYRQMKWLADTLTEMLGVDELNRLVEEIGL